MKKLLLVRHAKSDWKADDFSDFERSLSKRGLKDAPLMGEYIKSKNIFPDLIVSSAANRAVTTAEIIGEILNYDLDSINSEIGLYLCGADNIFNNIKRIDDNINTLMIVAHNPDLTILSNYLAEIHIDNIPSCGIVFIELNIDKWQDIAPENSRLVFFQYPKSI